jgi:ABC-type sugar transport system substrate-binding protein
MMEVLPDGGKLATLSIINAGNMREGVKGFTDYINANGGGKYEIVANEDDNGDASKAAEVTLRSWPPIRHGRVRRNGLRVGRRHRPRPAGSRQAAGDVKVTAMEQTPDFFKTAKEGWVDGIVVQNRELLHLLRGQDCSMTTNHNA